MVVVESKWSILTREYINKMKMNSYFSVQASRDSLHQYNHCTDINDDFAQKCIHCVIGLACCHNTVYEKHSWMTSDDATE